MITSSASTSPPWPVREMDPISGSSLSSLPRAGAEDTAPENLRFSVITVTYGRDHIVQNAIDQIGAVIGDRRDAEFILVDNNPDAIDRSAMLAALPRAVYVKLGFNKGVAARNDGALAAKGEFLLFVDDDALLNPLDALDRLDGVFAANPKLAIVSSRHVDAVSGETPRASFPHTDKSLPKNLPFKTFRFQGNGFAMRRSAFEAVGPMSSDYFYGLEEIDYAYRVVEAGFELAYEPSVWVVEHNDPGGRRPHRDVEEMRLTNKMIISWKYMPLRLLPLNVALFSAYVFALNRGRINPARSAWAFMRWAKQNPGRRTPIGPGAQAYIRACGGQVWK